MSRKESQDVDIDTSVETEFSDADERSTLAAELARATEKLNIIFQENVLLKEKRCRPASYLCHLIDPQ